MRKYKWTIIAGACVVVLIVLGAIFIPRLFSAPSAEEPSDYVTVMPGHWWKISLNQEQLETLRGLWGTDVDARQVIDAVSPGVLRELPEDVVANIAAGRNQLWPTDSFEEWEQIQAMCCSRSRPLEKGVTMFDLYIGCRKTEAGSRFEVRQELGISEENRYRISLYTDDVLVPPLHP